ncbi:MAG: hypothetical protein IPP89_12905 [Saprospiraceae bacterium]|nr:hypothetical protein [Candidatus Brachybacter algidus]MBL0119848.1 hypothetical protein [Candidatus Brachybacter algidus]
MTTKLMTVFSTLASNTVNSGNTFDNLSIIASKAPLTRVKQPIENQDL